MARAWKPGIRKRLGLVLLVLLASAAAPAADGRSAEAALAAVRETLDAAQATVEGEGSREEKLARLRELSRGFFDTDAMARAAMGEVLDRQSKPRRHEFLELWEEYVVRAYLQKLLFFRRPRFRYGRPIAGDHGFLVPTSIQTRHDAYSVDYLLRWRKDRGWLATDIVVEGMSLSHNLGAQLSSLLRRRGFEELLARLRRKVARHRSQEGA